jgi:hypothetical protein
LKADLVGTIEAVRLCDCRTVEITILLAAINSKQLQRIVE